VECALIRLLNAYIPKRTLLLGISEACLITLALLASALARLGAGEASFMLTYQYGALKILFVAVALLTCMYYFDLYDSTIVGNRREAPVRLVQVMGVAYPRIRRRLLPLSTGEAGAGNFPSRVPVCWAFTAALARALLDHQ
jgi:hypothetical protein